MKWKNQKQQTAFLVSHSQFIRPFLKCQRPHTNAQNNQGTALQQSHDDLEHKNRVGNCSAFPGRGT